MATPHARTPAPKAPDPTVRDQPAAPGPTPESSSDLLLGEDRPNGTVIAMLARAEAAVADLCKDYPFWVKEDIASIHDCVKRAKAILSETRTGIGTEIETEIKAAGSRAFELAHNIKGQGTSFGYPLMTAVGISLCEVLRHRRRLDRQTIPLVEAHARLMDQIIDNGLKDDGGKEGQVIHDHLVQLNRAAPPNG